MNTKPTLHFSLILALLWGSYASVLMFGSMFLLAKGLTNTQVGYVIAAGSAASALLQPLAGAYADRSEKNILHRMSLLLSALTILTSSILLAAGGIPLAAALLFALLLTLIYVITPLIYSLGTFFMARGAAINFGISRGTGSLASALTAAVLGVLVQQRGEDTVIWSLILFYALMAAAVASFHFKGIDERKTAAGRARASSGSGLADFLKAHRRFTLLLAGCVLVFISHNVIGIYTYQIIVWHGYSSRELGYASTLTSACELPALFGLSWLNKKISSAALLKISMLFMFLKNLFMYLASGMPMVYFAICMQLFGYGLFAGISVLYVNEVIAPENQAKGQALMTATISVGAVIGSILGGKLLDVAGVPTTLLISGVCALAGMILSCAAAS